MLHLSKMLVKQATTATSALHKTSVHLHTNVFHWNLDQSFRETTFDLIQLCDYFSVTSRWEKAPPSSLCSHSSADILPAPGGSADACCLPCSINSRMQMPEPSLQHLAPSYQVALCEITAYRQPWYAEGLLKPVLPKPEVTLMQHLALIQPHVFTKNTEQTHAPKQQTKITSQKTHDFLTFHSPGNPECLCSCNAFGARSHACFHFPANKPYHLFRM